MRGAWGLGSPEVRLGAVGAARLFGALPVPARIVAKRPGGRGPGGSGSSRWSIASSRGRAGGCEVAVDLIAPPPLERAVAAAYGPVIAATLRRLARLRRGRLALLVGPVPGAAEVLARRVLALAVALVGHADPEEDVEQQDHHRAADQRDARALLVLA